MATLLVHIALLAYAAAAAAYLTWLVRPRERLVSAGRALLFTGLLLHLTSFAAAVSLSHVEGLARAVTGVALKDESGGRMPRHIIANSGGRHKSET